MVNSDFNKISTTISKFKDMINMDMINKDMINKDMFNKDMINKDINLKPKEENIVKQNNSEENNINFNIWREQTPIILQISIVIFILVFLLVTSFEIYNNTLHPLLLLYLFIIFIMIVYSINCINDGECDSTSKLTFIFMGCIYLILIILTFIILISNKKFVIGNKSE